MCGLLALDTRGLFVDRGPSLPLQAVDKYPVFGAQMDMLLACKAEAATANNVLIFNALQLLVRDSMRLYQVMTMIVSRLIGARLDQNLGTLAPSTTPRGQSTR